MSLIVVPEFVLHTTLEAGLKFVRTDFAAHVADETKSYLYKMLTSIGFQKYNLYQQAKQVVCNTDDDKRRLRVDLMFNQYHDKIPTITIMLPAESANQQNNGLGVDEGFEEGLYDEGDAEMGIPGSYTPVLTRRYQAVYDLIITSDNSTEVILLYHFLKALLTALTFHFHQQGIQNIFISGQDVSLKEEKVRSLFTRAVRVNLQYDTAVPVIHSIPMPHSLGNVDGTPVLDL